MQSSCAITRRRFVRCLTTLCLATASTAYLSTAMAQTWPSRTVTRVVPSVAGSAPDTYARALAERMAEATGGTFLVENKPAASGNVAAESVLRAPMDGHTWLIGTQALMTTNPSTFSGLRWKTGDFKGVVKGVEAPLVLVTSAAVAVKRFDPFAGVVGAQAELAPIGHGLTDGFDRARSTGDQVGGLETVPVCQPPLTRTHRTVSVRP